MQAAKTWRPALPTLILLAALLARLIPGPRTIDDAFITFRYARNLLSGDGLVYNPGEAVLGTTTPLYAGLLTLAGLATGGAQAPFPQVAMVLNALAGAATCLLLVRMGRRLEMEAAGWAAAFAWALLPFSVTFDIGGLETGVFVLLLTGTTLLYLEGRFTAAALLASLSLLARPDALLLLAPLGIDRLLLAMRNQARIRWAEAGAFSLPLLAWVVPAAAFYGSPIPHSLVAKAAAYALPPDAAFSRLVQHYATPFMDNLTFGSAGIAAGLFLYPALAAIGTRRLLKNQPRAWPWLALPWTWFAAYAIANPLIFRWYQTPPLPPYLFAIFAGLVAAGRDLRNALAWRSLHSPLTRLVLLLPTLLLLHGWTWTPDHGLPRPAPKMAWYELELKYHEAAAFLQPFLAADPEAAIAAADIGVLGYETGAPILDTLGLVSPEAVSYYPTRPEYHVNAYAVPPELILDLQPDYLVLLEVYGREGLFKDPAFQQGYRLIHIVVTDIYGSEGMLVFRRR